MRSVRATVIGAVAGAALVGASFQQVRNYTLPGPATLQFVDSTVSE